MFFSSHLLPCSGFGKIQKGSIYPLPFRHSFDFLFALQDCRSPPLPSTRYYFPTPPSPLLRSLFPIAPPPDTFSSRTGILFFCVGLFPASLFRSFLLSVYTYSFEATQPGCPAQVLVVKMTSRVTFGDADYEARFLFLISLWYPPFE